MAWGFGPWALAQGLWSWDLGPPSCAFGPMGPRPWPGALVPGTWRGALGPGPQRQAKLAAAVARQGNKVSADGLKLTANLSGDHIPGGKLDAELEAGVAANLANKSLQMTGLSLRANELRVDGGVSVSKFDSDALALTGKLNVAQFNLRKLMEALGQPVPVTADANVLTAVAVQADLKGSRNAVSLAPLSVKLDESNVTGSFSVSDVSRGALRFDLTMDQIDADRYLPPKAEGKAASPGVAAAGGARSVHYQKQRKRRKRGKTKQVSHTTARTQCA